MSAIVKHNEKQHIIGRWKLSKLIHKGRNAWIHEGIDIHNHKTVVLKFIAKADKSWIKQQTKQIETEIKALQKIKHPHTIKLYAFNLNAKYPTKGINCVLLVLEYATNGELFNLLYYTSGLNELISRTYFKQITSAIEFCHNRGVIHRDLRPKNILLNHQYSIKIGNFASSKCIETDSDFLMKTKYFGRSKCYQSPQLLSDTSLYDSKCDVFSIGVLLFILLAGYPPFEEATKHDRWYKQIIDHKFDKFWKYHRNVAFSDAAKDLLVQLLAFDAKLRINITDIKKHEWFQGPSLERFALRNAIQQRYNAMEHIRRQTIRGAKTSRERTQSKPLPSVTTNALKRYKLILFPLDKIECMEGDVYTFGWDNTRPIYDFISEIISAEGRGSARYNAQDNKLYCKMTAQHTNDEMEIQFVISIYQSRLWHNRYLESDDGTEEIVQHKEHLIYIACIQRSAGDELLFHKVKNEFLLMRCSSIFKGLPQWARRMTPNIILDNYCLQLLLYGYWAEKGTPSTFVPMHIIEVFMDFYRDKTE
eukprot:4089_1